MALSSSINSSCNNIELLSLNTEYQDSPKNEKKKPERTVNFSSEIDINGNKMHKNVQFSQVSDEDDFEMKPNLIPNRKR
jgi:hypothetical protein